MPQKFNLLDEKWILVETFSGQREKVSLMEVFERAHNYRDLANELKTLDFAILRLLLAVIHAVYGARADGSYLQLEEEDERLELESVNYEDLEYRWKLLWDRQAFSTKDFENYLETYRERFYLFDEEHPFYQVPSLRERKTTSYEAAKLLGTISQSSNKKRLFASRTGEERDQLDYDEAARWLIYVNAYDDTSAKPKTKGLPSPGAGWLGQLGLVAVQGNNLFETLMLNYLILNPDNEAWGIEKPIWACDKVPDGERVFLKKMPDNLSQHYTLQSRRLLLNEKNRKVIGYELLGGDIIPKENEVEFEPMTLWRIDSKTKTERTKKPMRHDESKQVWQEFQNLLIGAEFDESRRGNNTRPGVIEWISRLVDIEYLNTNEKVTLQTAAVLYGDKDFTVDNVIEDDIRFYRSLLKKNEGEERSSLSSYLKDINFEVIKTEEVAKQVWILSSNLQQCQGVERDQTKGKATKDKERFYYLIDTEFRRWLTGIDPNGDKTFDDYRQQWNNTLRRKAFDLAESFYQQAGPRAVIGRIAEGKGGNVMAMTSARALNIFKGKVFHLTE